MTRTTLLSMALAASLLPLLPGCGGAPVDPDETGLAQATQPLMYGGHDYLFIRSPKTWDEARNICASLGYGLVTINDAQENAWLYGFEGKTNQWWWLGYNDIAREGSWQWLHGTSTYVNWRPSEPNNGGGSGNENCAIQNYTNASSWDDLNCASSEYFICESLN